MLMVQAAIKTPKSLNTIGLVTTPYRKRHSTRRQTKEHRTWSVTNSKMVVQMFGANLTLEQSLGNQTLYFQ